MSNHCALPAFDSLLIPQLLLPQLAIVQHTAAVVLPARNHTSVLHRPPPDASLQLLELGQHPAQQRLVFEELVAQQLSMLQIRSQSRGQAARPISADQRLTPQFLAGLAFTPTGAQQRVVQQILQDLQQTEPMLRLVQGDVGSGKTLVAALAALPVIAACYQVALMAPTELLSEQHAQNFRRWLEPLGIQVAWLGGKSKGKARDEQLAQIADGRAQLVIGTHALFQQQVQFSALCLVIIDEQHRCRTGATGAKNWLGARPA